jgi:hypothetical protein
MAAGHGVGVAALRTLPASYADDTALAAAPLPALETLITAHLH